MEALPGLDGSGSTAAQRRARLAAASDEELAEQLALLATSLRETQAMHAPIAAAASLPIGEVLASPFALRAVALAVDAGASTVHHELRLRMDWPERLGVAAEVRDADHGVWERGVLKTGKYQGFLADEPFASYDPAHVSKWGAHELLHRAASFFWRAGATRWEHYLGARLNELVPVVTWYGPEQAMRLDEGAFDRAAAGRAPSAPFEDARWLTDQRDALEERARRAAPLLKAGIVHFERELAAIDEELASGRRVRVPHPLLDASSDATAYVVGHFERLQAAPVTAVLNALPPSLFVRDAGDYRDFVEALFDRLLFAPIAPDLERADARRSGRALWDLLHRATHLGEGIDDALEPLLDEAGRAIAAAEDGHAIDLEAWRARIAGVLAEEEADAVLADGSAPALGQLADGIESVLPCTRALLDDRALAELAAADALWDRAPLSMRVARWIEDPALEEMARFEHAIAFARRDDAIERLCVPAGEIADGDGVLIASATFERHRFEHAVVEAHAAWSAGEAVAMPARALGVWLIGAFFEGVSVLPCPDAVARALDRLKVEATPASAIEALLDRELGDIPEGWPADGAAWIRELLDAGAVGWLGHRPL